MSVIDSDILAGEELQSIEETLSLNDSCLNPTGRPTPLEALDLLKGKVGPWEVPFASARFKHHLQDQSQGLFNCLFGRDSLVIASFLKEHNVSMQENVMFALSQYQGKEQNLVSEEEHGRIPHEVREFDDPQAKKIAEKEGWTFPYYGSIDATLLWLKTLSDVSERKPQILEIEILGITLSRRAELAASWLLSRLDVGGGLLRSQRSNPRGLLNQTWKDSGDSYSTSTGIVAVNEGTASVEIIGQSYDALLSASRIARRSNYKWQITPDELENKAESLKGELFANWWLGTHFALGRAIINNKEIQLDSLASNQWWLLDSEILDGNESRQFVNQLADSALDTEILGPNGLRTLGKSNARYRPGGYHSGSTWPFDCAIITRGLLKHGRAREAKFVAYRTIEAIKRVGGYPEFFRSDLEETKGINRHVIDVWDPSMGLKNRVNQPPQMLQGWTIAAFMWFQKKGLAK